MAYLPDELWLLILPYCNRQDAWLALRPLNRQLRDCVESYFVDNVLPSVKLHLDIALPSYDVRQRLQGRAVFVYTPSKKQPTKSIAPRGRPINVDDCRAYWRLASTEPDEQYRTHILARWESMANASAHSLLPGSLDERLVWKVPLHRAESLEIRLPRGQIEWATNGTGSRAQNAELLCEWRPMLTGLFRKSAMAREIFPTIPM